MIRTLHPAYACLALVALLAAPFCSAATEVDTPTNGVFPITSTNNLLLNFLGGATYTGSAGQEGYANPTAIPPSTALVDGAFGTAAPSANNASVATLNVGFVAVFDLDLTTSPTGYFVNSIESFGGWNDAGRDQQSYTVAYQPLAGGAFVDIATVNYNPPGGTPTNSRVTLTDLGIDAVAIRALRFTINAQENGHCGYREFSAIGTPAAPVSSAPTISPSADGFTTPTATITITNTQAGGTTYYTVDGTVPNTGTPTFTTTSADVVISAATTVRALTVTPGLVNNSALRNYVPVRAAETPTNDAAAGVRARYYKTQGFNGFPLPDFPNLTPNSQMTLPTLTLAANVNPFEPGGGPDAANNNVYSIQFTGYINVPADGVYTFFISSDDGSRLLIGNTQVVDNNFYQGFGTFLSGTIGLQQGKHPITVLFAENTGGAELRVDWQGPGFGRQVVPGSVLSTEPVAELPVIALVPGPGTTFTGTTQVSITSNIPSATIYYTLDGSTPTIDSHTGSFPSGGTFQITQSSTVKALAYLPPAAGFSSAIASATFTRTAAATDAPRLVGARVVSPTQVDATFDVDMGAGAATAANYAITGGINVTNAALDANLKTVHLTVSALTPTTTYTLTVSNVQSAAAVVIGSANTATFRALPNGVYFERFYDASINSNINSLLTFAGFINNTPTNVGLLEKFYFPNDIYGSNYGSRSRAYLIAPETGVYSFRIAADDDARLYVSPNATAASKLGIAGVQGFTNPGEFTKFPEDADTESNDNEIFNDQYGTISLTAGQLYYIEAQQAEGGGGDHLQVQWSLPSAPAAYADIPHSNLIAFSNTGLTTPPNGGILRERYNNINGTAISDLTNSPKFPASPDVVDYVPTFESPQDPAQGDNYGMRLSGIYTHVAPLASGSHNFYIAGDDDCQLWFSTDENPANATLICNKVGGPNGNRDWQTINGRKSPNITLTLGNRYFMFALLKEGGGGDGVAVAVLPTGTDPVTGAAGTPAITDALSPSIPLQITSQTTSKRVRVGQSTTLRVDYAGGIGAKSVRWFKNGLLMPTVTSNTYTIASAVGADTASYTVEVLGSSNGVNFTSLTSAPIALQVFADIAIDTATLTQTFDSTPRIVTATSTPGGLPYSVTYNGAAQAINAGTYPIVVSATGGVEAVANGSLVVSPVTGATVALTPQTVPYDRLQHGLTFTTVPPTLNVTVTYDGSTTQPTNAGTYSVVATINDTNAVGNPSDTDTLIISKLDLTVAADAKTRVYGDTSALGLTFNGTGFVSPETIAVLTGTPTLTTTAVAANAGTPDPGSDVGSYAITLDQGSLAATNYNLLAFTDSTYTVTKRPLDLSAGSITLEYGVPTPSSLPFTVVAASLAPGDAEADALTGGAPVVSSTRQTLSSVGAYPITLQPGTLAFTNNYMLGATTGGTITVVPTTTASLVVPPTTLTYTGAPQGVVPVTTPGALSTTITYNGSATLPTNAGTYAVVATINDTDSAVSPSANGTLTINKATAVVSLVNLFQTENGTPRPVSVVTSPPNLVANVTYNGSATAPTLPGTYAVVATINEPNYQGTASGTLRVGGPPPLITSPLAGTPNPVQVGKTITFSVAATHPLNLPLTITFDYGDGTSDTTGVHVYTFPQIATVVASVSDGISTITSSLQVLVVSAASPDGDLDGDGINNSIDTDDDGDGLSDIFEDAIGSSPLDAGNLPLDDPNQAKNPGPLDVKKMSIKLSFTKLLSDSIAISGTLPVKAGFTGSNKKFVVDVGGVIKSFTLGSKNTAKVGGDSIKLSVKAKKGVVSADQAAKYSIKISKGTFGSTLADDGLGNENAKNKATTVRVDVLFNGQYLRKLVPQIYSAKQGNSGRTK